MTKLMTIAWCLGIVLTSFGSYALDKKNDYIWNYYTKWSEMGGYEVIYCSPINMGDKYKNTDYTLHWEKEFSIH